MRRFSTHICGELNKLVRSGSVDPVAWRTCLEKLRESPYQIKAATGKEVALTLHGLSVSQVHVDHDILNRLVERAAIIAPSAMNEQSLALSFVGIQRLEKNISGDVVLKVFNAIPEMKFKDPRNIANICYVVSMLRSISPADRGEALSGWIQQSILSFPATRFKVKDIVQILHACSRTFRDPEIIAPILQLMETAVMRQLQYMDSVAVSSVINSFGRMGYLPSNSAVVEGLIATGSQHIGDFNARSYTAFISGLGALRNCREFKISKTAESIIFSEAPRILPQLDPERFVTVLRSLNKLVGNTGQLSGLIRAYVGSVEQLSERDIIHLSTELVAWFTELEMKNFQRKHLFPILGRERTSFRDMQSGIEIMMLVRTCSGHDWTRLIKKIIDSNSVELVTELVHAITIARIQTDTALIDSIESVFKTGAVGKLSREHQVRLANNMWTLTGRVPEYLAGVVDDEWRHKTVGSWAEISFIGDLSTDLGQTVIGMTPCPPGETPMSHPEVGMKIDTIDPEFRSTVMSDILLIEIPVGAVFPGDILRALNELEKFSGVYKRALLVNESSSPVEVMNAVLQIHNS